MAILARIVYGGGWMSRNGKAPPSRAGRRQVTCYLDPPLLAAVKAVAWARRETLQQALARGVNAELARRGLDPMVTCEAHHLFARVEKPARPRASAAPSRLGRTVIAGWFDRNEVDRLRDFAAEVGTSVQDLAAAGLRATAATGEGEAA